VKIEKNGNKQELDSLRQQRSKLVDAEATEIETLKSYFQGQKEKARTGHVEELGSLQNSQRNELLATIDQFQERLHQKLDSYKAQESDLEKSRLALIEANKRELQDIRAEFLNNRDSQVKDTLARTEDLRHNSDQTVKKAHTDASRAASDGQRYFGLALDQQTRSNEAHLRRNEAHFKQEEAEREREKSTALQNISEQTGKAVQYETNRSQNILEGQRRAYETQITVEQEKFKALLNQQRENFQQRYATLKAANDRVINHASSQLSRGVNELQAKFINDKELIAEKSKDSFYHPTVLQPRVEDGGRFYLVHLDIPEHEKEFVTFNANQRILKLSFTRKMAENFETADGSVNKSNRSELMTKEISVPEIVNAKTVNQKYENGVLTFRIAKA